MKLLIYRPCGAFLFTGMRKMIEMVELTVALKVDSLKDAGHRKNEQEKNDALYTLSVGEL